MDGILPLWKPKGFTSHDCVMKVRRLYKTKKVGHTGTLDPEVEGVLPICIGQATKIVPFLTDTNKTYIAEATIGFSTETEDSHGSVIDKVALTTPITSSMIESVLKEYQGTITQVPPMYSAVKVNGKKLYEYAREGKEVERPNRKVFIKELELLTTSEPTIHQTQPFTFRVVCSKGTYIRTLCVDIGKALGYPAHMSELERTQTGSFDKSNTVTFGQIEEAVENGKEEELLSPMKKGVDHLDVLHIDDPLLFKVKNGQKLPLPSPLPKTNPFQVQHRNELVAIYQIHPTNEAEIKPLRIFHTSVESR
ncbi:tRNA pseudouridine(55) synthase TruB [Aquibacillus koreensis]|uniref:tRNA pseudouridine synthase B n=1 Tax=Aquibacillus koreensis TaxID=279446 RepID=A0A9X4AKX5_9BACI|nr:tRNA pseudouridine(55) synthase TruB [Aquibacillus koreensis]MCT2534568.1 tRNA pseudouridine(55) synthase TruB [Aquibacillus koreensis]MDC3421838.1 tRNA pseudouridine(55) synthase TruB [Aquibacillus koreensis]